jgi:hypothetical protein
MLFRCPKLHWQSTWKELYCKQVKRGTCPWVGWCNYLHQKDGVGKNKATCGCHTGPHRLLKCVFFLNTWQFVFTLYTLHPWRSGLEEVLYYPLCVSRGCPSDETGKTEATYHSRYDTMKIPPCSKALSKEHRPKFCSPSTVMVTSSYK